VLQEASQDREEVLVVECDLAHLENVRRNWPFFRDRRIDSYEPILRRLIDPST
jgi:N-carbamoylputrescine amidase